VEGGPNELYREIARRVAKKPARHGVVVVIPIFFIYNYEGIQGRAGIVAMGNFDTILSQK